ncbi:hypothetical protein N7470_005811 [Penicillium chermesinum]|nr:hypothetical protein N7470_005811 [Penicillium chermesinum]
MEKSDFKVVIVGGSIAGLTLAHSLAKANIDHVVLEKRSEIAPQEGAFIGIWPNGARVLHQLGLWTSLEKLTAPISRMHICFPDGYSFSSLLPKKIHEKLFYPIVSLDRQKVLEILYRGYPTKSKILTDQRVSKISLQPNKAIVFTDSGEVYPADLVVGADGVHSRVRSEMWRLAEEMEPDSIPSSEKNSLAVEYVCVFGISSAVPGLKAGEHINRYGDRFSIITFHGRGDRIFWFIIEKLDQKYVYPNAPRFTTSKATELCDKLADVRLLGDICVRDLWNNRVVASMTVLEEGIFKTWHFNRIALMGDSAHKMTPNIGQGANTAIEDAAVLASLIHGLSQGDISHSKSTKAIESMLQEYQSLRYGRAMSTYQRSRFGARFHTRDDWVKRSAGRYIFPYIGPLIERATSKVLATGDTVDFLPLPGRTGSGWTSNSSKAKKESWLRWYFLWGSSLVLCWIYFKFLVPPEPNLFF